MNRTEWAMFYRDLRIMQRDHAKHRRIEEFDHDGRPYKAIARPGRQITLLACRIPDRPTQQLVARELAEAAEDRRTAATGRWGAKSAKTAARMTLQMARQFHTDRDWRERARAAAQPA